MVQTLARPGGELWPEEDLVPISALEHYSYCPRQCALVLREQTFGENLYTLRGAAVHERVDEGVGGAEDGVRVERSLPLWSARLGLIGRADVVEFRDSVPYPVEYKSGQVSAGRHAEVQVCAQALCLEEMLGVPVPSGAVYQASSRRREVIFTSELRARVEVTVVAVRMLMVAHDLPPVLADGRCPNCSLIDSCLPFVIAGKGRLRSLARRLYVAEEMR